MTYLCEPEDILMHFLRVNVDEVTRTDSSGTDIANRQVV